MTAFVAYGNTCKRFWDDSVHEVQPRGTHAGLWEIENLLTDYQVSQFLQAYELSIFLAYVKAMLDPAKKFGTNHVGHSDIDALHAWSYVVSTSIELAPKPAAIMCDGDIGSLTDQSEVLYVFVRVQARCDVFIDLRIKHTISDCDLLCQVDGLIEANAIRGESTSVGS